jgi:hypothetical protein
LESRFFVSIRRNIDLRRVGLRPLPRKKCYALRKMVSGLPKPNPGASSEFCPKASKVSFQAAETWGVAVALEYFSFGG